MPRPKKGSIENPITTEELKDILEDIQKPIEIIAATIKDGMCNYRYEIKTGVGVGDKINVTGGGIITDDLSEAMAKFNVHLAAIDEIFKYCKIEIDDIENFHTHELTAIFRVSGFKIHGNSGNETISLEGVKYVSSAGGWMDITTHKVQMDQYSSYAHWKNLLDAADVVRTEVELYREGKCTPVEKPEPTTKYKQKKIFDKDDDVDPGDDGQDDEFKDATV